MTLRNEVATECRWVGLWLLFVCLINAGYAQNNLIWTAFNDHYAGQASSSNATAWNVFGTNSGAPGNSGYLRDVATGNPLLARLTIQSSGTIGQGTTSGKPAANTPSDRIFNGVIDWSSGPAPTGPQVNPSAYIDYIFSGLDPQKQYGFIGTGVRGGSGGSYALRWSLIEIIGAITAVPAHTTGAAVYTNGLAATQMALNTGQNSITGDYAEWDLIQPASDGTFTIRCSYYSGPIPGGTAGGPYCYGLMAIRLKVILDTTPPVMQSVIPSTNEVVSKLTSLELFFSKPVTHVDASDLLINGSPAISRDEITSSHYLFYFDQPAVGTVLFAWKSDHGITDRTYSSNRFAGGSWSCVLDTNIYYDIRLNEIMTSNKHGIRDEDGDYSDWIELYNSSADSVSLEGYHLTDDSLNLTKWAFPAVSITPGGYMIIWASEKNRIIPTAPLHANFKLNNAGGYLALVMPNGTNIVSAFSEYPAQYSDVSFGRGRLDPMQIGYYTTPTPLAPNATTGKGFGPDVTFSRESGTFIKPFSLVLSSASTNAVIRYRFGTNVPSASDTIYTGPIQITNTLQIRARTYVSGLLPGDVQSRDFIRLETVGVDMTRFSSPLPIVVFHNYGGGDVPVKTQDQFAMIQVFEPKNGRSSMTNIPDVAVQGAIHRRGQATLYNAKANLRVETRDEHGGGKEVSLLGMPADNDWVFYGIDGFDKVLMHNPLAHGLYRQMGHYSSRTRYVEVFLKTTYGQLGPLNYGDYNGLYVVEEKIKISKDRVDIDKLQPENTNAPSITGGYLYSVDKDGSSPALNAANGSMWYLDPDGPTIAIPQRASQRKYINDYLNAFYSALMGASWTNLDSGYAAYIDVPVWIDYHLHQVLVFNADMLRISSYYCKPRDGKIRPAALWDFDRAFGMYSAGRDQRGFNPWLWRSTSGDGGTDPFNAASIYQNPWYGRLFKDPDFWQKWIDRYQELRMTVYSSSNVTAMIDRFGNEVAEATSREYARWAGQGSSDTTPNAGLTSGDGWGYTFPTPGTWPGMVEFTKTWFTNRMTFMDGNFLSAPAMNRQGGQVDSGATITISPSSEPGSYVYFTLDGRDPRVAGGGILPGALSSLGSATIVVTNNIRIVARSYNPKHRNTTGVNNPPLSSPWSGPAIQSFYTAVPSLRISEIMYHPNAPLVSGATGSKSLEFIELVNIGVNTLNLAGFKLSGDVNYLFSSADQITELAPGDRVLVVSDLAACSAAFPKAAPKAAGQYGGNLNNGGNRIALTGPLGEFIHDFTFDNQWYPNTDGLGYSLVPVDENAPLPAWNDKTHWRQSALYGGSPGDADPALESVPPVFVNEILAHPDLTGSDAIELWNPNSQPVNIGYWYLTDDRNVPTKYLIPPGTVISANGYLVFEKTASFGVHGFLNALGTTNTPFGLGSNGEEVYLFSGDSLGRLTGFVDGLSFGVSAPGVAFGRFTNSLGNTLCVALSSNTLGKPNSAAMVGPVVISQLMYHPRNLLIGQTESANYRDEYIQLYNLSDNPAPMFDTNNPANTWQITGAVHYEFPQGVVMPPKGFILVVNFSPEADPAALAGFKAQYGLSNNIPILGPYDGKLNLGGGRINLKRPLEPDPITLVAPMFLVDRVEYDVTAPWPKEADGAGACLMRRKLSAYGNDPANWIAANPQLGFVPAPEQPVNLSIELNGNRVLISWPDSSTQWQLEEAIEITSPSSWTPSPLPTALNGNRWEAQDIVQPTTHKYFRLKW